MTARRCHLIGFGGALLSSTALVSPASAQVNPPASAQANPPASGPVNLGDVVVTATGRPEPTNRIAGTTQVIDRAQIERSTAKSVTDLLAENAVGFMTQWTSDQTQVVIRGGQSDGQGRDFKSEVLILINGHRSGTANISKLSLADVERIEIVKGPSSVVYGSQNMGGVINIIMKTGLTAPGTLAQAETGSWELLQGKAQTGGVYKDWDYYASASGGRQSNYSVPGNGTELNTSWQRRAETGSLGWQADENNHVNFNIRQDGIYDAGFRGSGWSIFDVNNRYNSSAEMNYNGQTSSGWLKWYWQLYGVQDVDDLNEPNNLSTLRGTLTSVDDNKRVQDLLGSRFQPRFNLWQGNDLLLGWDYEHEQLRSDRFTLGASGNSVPQLAPTDNNQHVNENAFYFEDAQTFFDRWTLRGGLRETLGATSLDQTPVVQLQTSTHDYKALTYSVGSSYLVTDWLSGRVGASTGFRAPTATEFGQNFTVASSGSVLFGNPSLTPENSQQIEAGLTATWPAAKFDVAVFQNRILDRIVTQVTGVTATGATISMEENDPGAVVLDGVELQYKMDMLKLLSMPPDNWLWSVYGNAYYNFHMVDEGLVVTLPTDTNNKPIPIYESQFTFNTRFGQRGEPLHDWFIEITGIVNGHLWYNSEEHLNIPGQVANVTVFEEKPYTVWNMKGELKVTDYVSVWAKMNNIFNLNYNPILIALYQTPCIGSLAWANGSCGNSMLGREFIVGITGRW